MKAISTIAVFTLGLVFSFAARAEVVTIGISTVGLYELPTEISKRKGFYQEEGLDARKVVIRTPLHVAALLAGELDYSTVTGIISGASIQGLPLRTVMGWFDKPLHMLIARPNIKKLTDLKNKRVAVSSFGSIPHIMLREALAQAGMNPEKDITVLALGGSGDRLAALVAGTVDATPVDVAYIQRTEQLGLTNLLYLGDVVNLRLGGFAVAMDKIQRNPDQISRVIRATLKGVRFFKNNKPETLAIMRDYLKISGNYVEKIYQFALRSLNEDGLVAKSSLDNEIRLTREQLKIKDEIPESKVVEWKFIKEILAKR
jgi:NitT/TauT family transport system substrate-binding protein